MSRLFLALLLLTGAALRGGPHLASDGRTEYTIVLRGDSAADRLAGEELAAHLRAATGAEFRLDATEEAPAAKRIFVGGECENFAPQEYAVRTDGDDLILTGAAPNGALYAVYAFLEEVLGCRWYTVRDEGVIPAAPSLELPELALRRRPDFVARHHTNTYYPRPAEAAARYFNRNKFNVSMPLPEGISGDFRALGPFVHGFFFYMPPGETPAMDYYGHWPSHVNLFAGHPDFFSQDANGKRVPDRQLCFSNPEMRRMLTGHLLEQLGRDPDGVVDLSANDVPGRFCYCPDCLALEKKYASTAGPLFDYLIEAAPQIAAQYPNAFLKTLAYRLDQSEIPPAVSRLPENLIVVFAPIDSDFAKPLDAPSNRTTRENLAQWGRIAPHLWVWYYPNPYGPLAPMANIDRLAADIKLMRQLGVEGAFFEHDVWIAEGFNFSELQSWLMGKLFDRTDADAAALIAEFDRFSYGPAAPAIRAYRAELEAAQLAAMQPVSWNPSLGQYSWLSPELLVKWQSGFDGVEAMPELADAPDCADRIRILRVALDMATLQFWPKIQKRGLQTSFTLEELIERLRRNYVFAVERTGAGRRSFTGADFDKNFGLPMLIARGQLKPVPAELAGIDPERIHQLLPFRNLRDDADAAAGIASAGGCDEVPLTFGTYDAIGKTMLATGSLPASALKADGRYHLHRFGPTRVTPNSVFFLSRSWFATFPLESLYVPGYPDREYELYLSVKVEGPAYGGNEAVNQVSCDRIILIAPEP